VFRRLGIAGWIVYSLALQAQDKLSIDRVELHQYEDGPVLPGSYEFLPGETVWFSARIGGFRVDGKDEERHVKLGWAMRVEDPAGVLLEKPRSGEIADRLSAEDKEWRPKFLANFQIPAFAIGGVYKIPVTVKDELAGTMVSRTLEFPVKGPTVPATDSLVIRNFRFLRNEEDTAPLRPAVYRRGSMLWARFDMMGFKLGDGNNKFDVGYGLAVLGPDGKELFVQPDAAGESKESFYPQRWMPGMLSLSLDANVAPAKYTLVVIVQDKLAGESTELREQFTVE
jgi:hypothetical protein